MKRIFMSLSAALGLAIVAGTAQADPGGYTPPTPGAGGSVSTGGEFNSPNTLMGFGAAKSSKTPERYGLLPGLRKMFHLDKGCSTCDTVVGSHGGHGGSAGVAQAPPVMQGTLVFPNHPYVRSPRDYFMYEPGR